MTRLADLAKTEGVIPPAEYGSDQFPRMICQAQNLAEQGQYAEAADVLSGLINDGLAPDWKAMLQTRVAILKTWHKSGRVELNDYSRFYLETGPHWFHQRLRPIVALWSMAGVPELDKYLLIGSLLDQRGDHEGQVMALEAVADLPTADEQARARALLRAGGARFDKGDSAGAERDWLRVRELYLRTPAWPEAVLSVGKLYKNRKQYGKAIDVLQALLNPERRVRAVVRVHDSAAYCGCLEIAGCYESLREYSQALKYAEMARDQYPFSSGCGTCDHSEQQRLGQMIKRLKEADRTAVPGKGLMKG